MKKYILGFLGLMAVIAVAGVMFTPVDAVLTTSWSCRLAANADGSGSAETWGNLRKPIYFDERQANYIIEREADTLIKPNTGQAWLPWKSVNCTKTS